LLINVYRIISHYSCDVILVNYNIFKVK